MVKLCNCKDWEENQPTLDGALIQSNLRYGTGIKKSFNYCPWCGIELREVAE